MTLMLDASSDYASIRKHLSDAHRQLVPDRGTAPTVAGEAVRALNYIIYRYENDGDRISNTETGWGPIFSSYRYLTGASPYAPHIRAILRMAKGCRVSEDDRYTGKDGYLCGLMLTAYLLLREIVDDTARASEANTVDSR